MRGPQGFKIPCYVGDQRVKVLRDTGCSTEAIRAHLVKPEQMTGETHMCVLSDGTICHFQIARVNADTPYYVSEPEAMCMREPIWDLVIGNLPGVMKASVVTQKAESPDIGMGQANAVVTRAQAKRAERPLTPLVVAQPPDAQSINMQELKRAHKDDPSLQKLWELAKEGKQLATRGQAGYQFDVRKWVLYRVYLQPCGNTAVEVT